MYPFLNDIQFLVSIDLCLMAKFFNYFFITSSTYVSNQFQRIHSFKAITSFLLHVSFVNSAMPTRNQIERAALIGLTTVWAVGFSLLIVFHTTPGPDGKPRRKINLRESTLSEMFTTTRTHEKAPSSTMNSDRTEK